MDRVNVNTNLNMENFNEDGEIIRRVRDDSAGQPSLSFSNESDPVRYGSVTEGGQRLGSINDSSSPIDTTMKTNLIPDDDDDEEAAVQGAKEAPAERDPTLEASEGHPTTSVTRTFVNFLKANLGTGILAMPDAIKNGGLFFGTGCLMLLGLLTCYSSHLLLHAYVQVSDGKPVSLARTVELVFRKAPGRIRKFSRTAYKIIQVVIGITQTAFLCVYILFVSKMVKEVVDSQIPPGSGPSIQIYEVIVLALLIPYCWVKTLHIMSIFALFANVVSVATIFIVLQYSVRNLQVVENIPWITHDIGTLPLFFGTALFSFECIGLILPMENQMKERKEFHGWNGLFSSSMACIFCLYAAVGFYGYLAFGPEAKMILSNMPPGDWLYNITKLLYALSIFLSFNLQIYVPVQIMFPPLKDQVNRPWFDRFGEYIMRTCMVLFTFGLAVSIPCLEYMISLFGCLCSPMLAFIMPPVLDTICCLHKGHRHRITVFMIVRNVCIVLIGISGLIIGTTVSILSIADALSSPGGCGA